MRIVLVPLVLVFALAGCAKKQAPPQSPKSAEPPPTESAPADSEGSRPDADAEQQDTVQGDPCDGGENK